MKHYRLWARICVLTAASISWSSCVDHIIYDPWELQEPDHESLCPELVDWQADDAFRQLPDVNGRQVYERRFPLAYDGCGVYAAKGELQVGQEGRSFMRMDTTICNRCDHDMQRLWVDDPYRYELSRQASHSWEGREVSGDDWRIDLGTSSDAQSLSNSQSSGHNYTLGPVTFIAGTDNGEALAHSCFSEGFTRPPALFRIIMKRKGVLNYRMNVYSGFMNDYTCHRTRRDRPAQLDTEISTGHMMLSWPRLQEMDIAFEWENAAYLPGAACEEMGVRNAMCMTTDPGFPQTLIETERPTLRHQENHFIQDVGVIDFPVALGNVFTAD